jgi:hypothetical protein
MAAALEAAEHWEMLADEQTRRGDWEAGHGRHAGAHRARAKSYKRAAESLRIEHRTGIAVCACCYKPLGRGSHIPGVR